MYESLTRCTSYSYSPGSSGARNCNSVLKTPPFLGSEIRLSANSSSSSPMTSHQPPSLALGKAGAKACRRELVLVDSMEMETVPLAPAASGSAGGCALMRSNGRERRRLCSSARPRALSLCSSAFLTACGDARSSSPSDLMPRAPSAETAASLIPGRSSSCGPSMKRPWVTICVRCIAPMAVSIQPPSAAMSTMACRIRSAWSSTDFKSVT
mmetsp:Transcript_51995/g.113228  ORF Transcript_51995/g.113228 Transcript_51995/m.113228 type:complete len:211 (+) Transcript_51995:184-816(+)